MYVAALVKEGSLGKLNQCRGARKSWLMPVLLAPFLVWRCSSRPPCETCAIACDVVQLGPTLAGAQAIHCGSFEIKYLTQRIAETQIPEGVDCALSPQSAERNFWMHVRYIAIVSGTDFFFVRTRAGESQELHQSFSRREPNGDVSARTCMQFSSDFDAGQPGLS